ncbi:MFS transporter [Desulfitobacterium chlororespirans]|uniref:MFS transporter n=1 Tax=Desulfitobacterium chlororespirans TaxID=51616 RepID=UPI001FA8C2E4|nr:MFS transporter [Desulfitobacterium chlororespirans]
MNVHRTIDNGKMNNFFGSIWIVLFFALVVDGFDQAVYGAALPVLMKELNLDPTVSGLLGSASLWGSVLGALLLGFLTDKIGRKKTLNACVFLFSFFTALCAMVGSNIYLFAIWRFFAGMGIAAITPVSNAILSEYSPKKSRRFLLTTNGIGVTLGQMTTSLLAVWLIPLLGWRGFFGVSIFGLILIPLVVKFIPETMILILKKNDKKEVVSILTKADPSFVPQADDEYAVDEEQKVKGSVGELFKNGLAWNTILIWIMFFVNMCIISTFLVWFPKIVTLMGYELKSALLLNTIYFLGSCCGFILAGKVAEKIGYKYTILTYYILNGIFLFLVTIKTSTFIFGVILFLFGFTLMMQGMLYPFTAANYPLAVRATGLGIGASVTRLGGAIAPIVIGILIAQGMTPVGVLRILLIPVVLGAVAAALTRKPGFE